MLFLCDESNQQSIQRKRTERTAKIRKSRREEWGRRQGWKRLRMHVRTVGLGANMSIDVNRCQSNLELTAEPENSGLEIGVNLVPESFCACLKKRSFLDRWSRERRLWERECKCVWKLCEVCLVQYGLYFRAETLSFSCIDLKKKNNNLFIGFCSCLYPSNHFFCY